MCKFLGLLDQDFIWQHFCRTLPFRKYILQSISQTIRMLGQIILNREVRLIVKFLFLKNQETIFINVISTTAHQIERN